MFFHIQHSLTGGEIQIVARTQVLFYTYLACWKNHLTYSRFIKLNQKWWVPTIVWQRKMSLPSSIVSSQWFISYFELSDIFNDIFFYNINNLFRSKHHFLIVQFYQKYILKNNLSDVLNRYFDPIIIQRSLSSIFSE